VRFLRFCAVKAAFMIRRKIVFCCLKKVVHDKFPKIALDKAKDFLSQVYATGLVDVVHIKKHDCIIR
jgi:hypothetical protein